jgi:hypothetical protein
MDTGVRKSYSLAGQVDFMKLTFLFVFQMGLATISSIMM